jgi:hypothetical protein
MCRTASDEKGRPIIPGAQVEILDPKTGDPTGRILRVQSIHKERRTFLHFDEPPLLRFPFVLVHPARKVRAVVIAEAYEDRNIAR